MEQDTAVRNYFVFDSIVAAIGSPIAKRLWGKGSCKAPKFDIRSFTNTKEFSPGELLMTIDFK